MRKIILVLVAIIFSGIIIAQEKGQPTKIKGKDIYTLLVNKTEFNNVGTVKLTEEQINSTTSLEERMELFIKNADSDFDLIMTRNGLSAILMKYKDGVEILPGNVIKIQGKDVYLLSSPLKKYDVLESKKILNKEIIMPFNKIVEESIKSMDKDFDAVLIKNNTVDYIVYQ
jgi:hypothetical protein